MPPFIIPLLVALGAFADVPPPPPPPPVVAPAYTVPLGDLAQRAARVAIRTAGLAQNDDAIDGIATRARLSALLPEVSLRATQTQAGMKDYASDTGTVALSEFGPGFSLQGALVFHLDRLAYSGQETRIERLRMERMEARARITQRVIDEMARWSRAVDEERSNPEGTPAHNDATIRRTNAQMALDVWTAGWFSSFLDGKVH
jgi:hypothetical protein